LKPEEIVQKELEEINKHISVSNHDTIGMIAIDANGNIACGK
jgi:isoaspartyl peptidase/L-asparaginase-like protein (Ntn-hydrolase superfamily)